MSYEVFRDRKWVAAIVISLLGVLVPVGLALLQRDRRAFTCDVIARATVLDLSQPTLKEVKASFAGRELKRLVASTVRLTNAGSVPIRRGDFDSPLTITVRGGVSFLTGTISDSTPQGFRPTLSQLANGLVIESVLWNPGDSMTLQIMTDGLPDSFEVSARLVGISQITTSDSFEVRDRQRAYLRISMMVLGLFGYGLFFANAVLKVREHMWVQAMSSLAAGLFMCVSGVLMFRYDKQLLSFGITENGAIWMGNILAIMGIVVRFSFWLYGGRPLVGSGREKGTI